MAGYQPRVELPHGLIRRGVPQGFGKFVAIGAVWGLLCGVFAGETGARTCSGSSWIGSSYTHRFASKEHALAMPSSRLGAPVAKPVSRQTHLLELLEGLPAPRARLRRDRASRLLQPLPMGRLRAGGHRPLPEPLTYYVEYAQEVNARRQEQLGPEELDRHRRDVRDYGLQFGKVHTDRYVEYEARKRPRMALGELRYREFLARTERFDNLAAHENELALRVKMTSVEGSTPHRLA